MRKKIKIGGLIFLVVIVASLIYYDFTHVSKQEYQSLVQNHPIQQRLQLTKKERKKMGIPPNRYYDDQYLLEMDPATGKTYPQNLQALKKNKKSQDKFSIAPGQNSENSWVERGPNNIGGRTRVVFYDPNDVTGKRVFAGGVSGGLWVNSNIEDETSVWSQVGIDENLAVSCFAIDPNDSNVWYIGTGEVYTQDDGTGNGIWVTKNGGRTWNRLLTVNLSDTVDSRPYYITQILAWDNNGTTEVFYAVDGSLDIDFVGKETLGWWKIEGTNFTRQTFNTSQGRPYVFNDVKVAKDNSIWLATKNNIFGQGGGKIFRSTDGVTFEEKYSFEQGDRVELALSNQNENVVYAIASTNNSSNVELVKSVDGEVFNSIAKPNDVDTSINPNDFARGQGFYNLTLEVDPSNDEILYAGGINLFKSINSGDSWEQISKWSNNFGMDVLDVSFVHADHHAISFNPIDSKEAVLANDGGVYFASDTEDISTENSIVARNNGYNVTQFYSGAIAQGDNDLLLGGAQDNGSLLSAVVQNEVLSFEAVPGVNSFLDIFGGDGIQNFIDKDLEYLIVSFVNNVYSSYPIPLESPEDIITIVNDQNSGSFANIADLDDVLDILYTDGTTGYFSSNPNEKISRFTDLIGTPQRRDFTDPKLFEAPTAIKASPFNTTSSTVFIGTQGASLLKVTNFETDTPTWENIDLNGDINIGSISDIDFGDSEEKIVVTLHNYGVNNIYYSTNNGISWEEKDGDFPDIPVKVIKMNPEDENEVIIGTNAGVWTTTNFLSNSPNWVQSQNGMSSVRVTDLDIRTSDNTVLAATYGRGLFTGKFKKSTPLNFKSNNLLKGKISIVNTLVTDGDLKLDVQNLDTDVKLEITSISGAIVFQKQILLNGRSTLEIPLNLSEGIYIVNIYTAEGNLSEKIIIAN